MKGRLVVKKDGRLSIEIQVDGSLAWAPVGDVRVELESGAVLVAKVNTSLSTKPGQYSAGVTVNLTLDVPPGELAAVRVMVMSGTQLLEVELSRTAT